MTAENLRTPLYDTHLALGGRMVPFGGWDMPVQYPSGILAEVNAVRTAAGIFDVSHMGRLYFSGPDAETLLDLALTGWASKLAVGRARYCLICNERGGVIDDTIFYRLDDDLFLLIPNAGNRPAVVDWLQGLIDRRFSGFCTMTDATTRTALIAVQGPGAVAIADRLCHAPVSGLRSFAFADTSIGGTAALVGRTGYTGEDGFEILGRRRCRPRPMERADGSRGRALRTWRPRRSASGSRATPARPRDRRGHDSHRSGAATLRQVRQGIRRLRRPAPPTRRGRGANAGGAATARPVGPPGGLRAVARGRDRGERHQRQLLPHA